MTEPTVDPHRREDVAATDSYQLHEPVWVWRNGWWREGTVRGIAPTHLMVDFRTSKSGGRAMDTVRPEYVMPRQAADGRTAS